MTPDQYPDTSLTNAELEIVISSLEDRINVLERENKTIKTAIRELQSITSYTFVKGGF